MAETPNPWSAEDWNITEQGRYVVAYGLEMAKARARDAGTTLEAGAPKNKPAPQGTFQNVKTIIFRRGTKGGSVGPAPTGSSGTGPPT